MSLNVNNGLGKGINPNPLPLYVNFGQWGSLPIDLFPRIFQDLKADLPSVVWVCRNWKALANDEAFRQMIRPAQAFGTKEWKEYIGVVDAGKEPCLPWCAYGDLEKNGGYLTFIPEKVKVAKEDGKVEDIVLDNLEAIGNLIKKPKTDLETGYKTEWCWEEAIKEKRQQDKPHWVWIKKEAIGRSKTYEQQQVLAKESGAKISGLIDTAISIFMEYVRSSERNFIWDPPVNGQRTLVRVNETTEGWRICLGFAPSGLGVNNLYDYARDYVGFVCARKSFGT